MKTINSNDFNNANSKKTFSKNRKVKIEKVNDYIKEASLSTATIRDNRVDVVSSEHINTTNNVVNMANDRYYVKGKNVRTRNIKGKNIRDKSNVVRSLKKIEEKLLSNISKNEVVVHLTIGCGKKLTCKECANYTDSFIIKVKKMFLNKNKICKYVRRVEAGEKNGKWHSHILFIIDRSNIAKYDIQELQRQWLETLYPNAKNNYNQYRKFANISINIATKINEIEKRVSYLTTVPENLELYPKDINIISTSRNLTVPKKITVALADIKRLTQVDEKDLRYRQAYDVEIKDFKNRIIHEKYSIKTKNIKQDEIDIIVNKQMQEKEKKKNVKNKNIQKVVDELLTKEDIIVKLNNLDYSSLKKEMSNYIIVWVDAGCSIKRKIGWYADEYIINGKKQNYKNEISNTTQMKCYLEGLTYAISKISNIDKDIILIYRGNKGIKGWRKGKGKYYEVINNILEPLLIEGRKLYTISAIL